MGTFERDLAAAAGVLAPGLLKLTGGEPLLHPRIVDLARAARASGLAPQLSLTTNGLLARAAPAALWPLLDRLTLSWYASAPLPERTHRFIEDTCAEHDISLAVKPFTSFQRITPPHARTAEEAARTHARCWMRSRCHLLHERRFYTCTRPPHLEGSGLPLTAGYQSAADGVGLEGPDLLERLLAYLEAETPLGACSLCLGGDGDWQPHAQLPLPAS